MGILAQCFGRSASAAKSSSIIEDLCPRFSLAQLRKFTNNFDPGRAITGEFGKLYKGSLDGGSDDTILILPANSSYKKETALLCQLRHPNLVSFIGFCNDKKNETMLVYEYLSNRSLHDHLHRNYEYGSMEPLLWKKRLEICVGIARGLHYLHTGAKRPIFHCDINPRNILLDKNWVPKIANLWISLKGPKFSSKPKPIMANHIRGTQRYMAPEYAKNGIVTDKVDVYSFGVLLLDVLCAKKSEDQHVENGSGFWKEKALVEKVSNFVEAGKAGEIIDQCLEGKIAPECLELFIDIAERCMLFVPAERPFIGEVEVELERALALQQEADERENGYYRI
ncbi:hypothetical protein L6164_007581 [Bauhinia variegata]|uniref:Uncharacterized protein n=1 Tax=Bauhinia variegata TaxID=167791 RepID=A0ACB9PDW0_BAUVA|nr:hypothetical protein L6164_007581 [Bauhinia variegata]